MEHGSFALAPAPSLVGQLHPLIEDTTQAIRDALMQLDEVANWDANETNHECLLSSIDSIKGQVKDWNQSFLNKLRTLWLQQTKEYNDYKQTVEKTLNIRHCAELDCLFPKLRDTATDIDLSGCSPYDEETKFKKHLFRLGFRYEAETKRLQALCRRQLQETAVFQKVTHNHSERMLVAKQADEKRLVELLQKPVEQIEMLIQAVEKKISASHVAATFTIYRKTKGPSPTQQPAPPTLPPTATVDATARKQRPNAAGTSRTVAGGPGDSYVESGNRWMPSVPHTAPPPIQVPTETEPEPL